VARYLPGHVEQETVDGVTLTWMVVELGELAGTLAWVSSAGDLCPLGSGPEAPVAARFPNRVATALRRAASPAPEETPD
jgi:hypothetical protein